MRSMKQYLAMFFAVCTTMLMLLSSDMDLIAQTLSEETVTGNSARLELSEFELSRVYNENNYENDFMPGEVIVGMKSTIAENQSISNITKNLNVTEVRDCYGKTIKINGNVDEVDRLKNSSYELRLKESTSPEIRRNIENSRATYTLKLSSNTKESVLEAIEMLKKEDSVAYAEPNYIVSPSALPSDYENYSLWGLDKIQVQQVWDQTTGTDMVRVGVLDTGFEYTHIDLASNIDRSLAYNATTGNDGYAADVSASPGHRDYYGHGTHVAGIIGAIGNNGVGITGINWEISIVPMKIAISNSNPSTNMALVKETIAYASSIGLPLVNLSYGISYTQSLVDAISEYPGLVIIAAGNNAQDNDVDSAYSAFSALDNVIFVANSESSDTLYSSSSYGDVTVDLAAPGTGIYSTIPGDAYGTNTGTSMAAPHVTGVAALIKSRYPNLTATQIKAAIMEGVTPVAALSGKCVTGGRLNAKGALDKAALMGTRKIVSGDFNGDGKDDVASIIAESGHHTQFAVQLSNGSGFGDQTAWFDNASYAAAGIDQRAVAGDFNGDGKDDLAVLYNYGDGDLKFFTYLSNGSQFSSSQQWNGWHADADYIDNRFVAGDFNGDGKDDVAVMFRYPSGTVNIFIFLSNGSSFTRQTWNEWSADMSYVENRFVAGDFNGDGKDDVAVMFRYPSGTVNIFTFLSNGSSFARQTWSEWSADMSYVENRFVAGDFNGDGKDDTAVLFCYPDGAVNLFVFQSNGTSFTRVNWLNWSANVSYIENRFTVGDFDGNSKDDAVVLFKYPSGQANLFTFMSTGGYFTRENWYQWDA